MLLASTAAPATARRHGLIVVSVDAVKNFEPSELDCLIAHEAAHLLLFHHAERARPRPPNKASLGAALLSHLRRLWVPGLQDFLLSFVGDTMDHILCVMSVGSVGCKGAGVLCSRPCRPPVCCLLRYGCSHVSDSVTGPTQQVFTVMRRCPRGQSCPPHNSAGSASTRLTSMVRL